MTRVFTNVVQCSLYTKSSQNYSIKTLVLILVTWDLLNLTKIPLLITQRAHGPGLEPSLYAVEVEYVPAGAEGDREAIFCVRGGISLILNRRLIERITANCTSVGTNVPRPHRHSIPL